MKLEVSCPILSIYSLLQLRNVSDLFSLECSTRLMMKVRVSTRTSKRFSSGSDSGKTNKQWRTMSNRSGLLQANFEPFAKI